MCGAIYGDARDPTDLTLDGDLLILPPALSLAAWIQDIWAERPSLAAA